MTKKRTSYVSEKLTDALIELLADKPFMEITVTDVVNRAEVSRVSFYRNFKTTSDILDYAIKRIITSLIQIAEPILHDPSEADWRNFLYSYIYYLDNSNQRFFLKRPENMSIVTNSFIENIHEIIPDVEYKDIHDKYDLTAIFFLINGVLLRWRSSKLEETPETIVDYIMEVIRPLITR